MRTAVSPSSNAPSDVSGVVDIFTAIALPQIRYFAHYLTLEQPAGAAQIYQENPIWEDQKLAQQDDPERHITRKRNPTTLPSRDTLFERRVVEPPAQAKDTPQLPLLLRVGLSLYLNALRTVGWSIRLYSVWLALKWQWRGMVAKATHA